MIKIASSAGGPVNYDAIVPLRNQEQFIKKNTGRDHEIEANLTGLLPKQPVKM